MIEIVVQDENGSRNIIFSGDIGQWNKPLLGNPSVFDRADYVVMESTYGDRNHDNSQDIDERLSKIVNDTVKAGGNILIPTFAIERAQELLYHFNRLARAERIPYIMMFLDSPMAVEITKVFERSQEYFDKETLDLFKNGQSPFDYPGLMLVESVEASKAINLIKGSTVIMAGSGMITGGRIEHHLIRNITRPESTLLFVGYQAAGTLGRQILDGVSPVEDLRTVLSGADEDRKYRCLFCPRWHGRSATLAQQLQVSTETCFPDPWRRRIDVELREVPPIQGRMGSECTNIPGRI